MAITRFDKPAEMPELNFGFLFGAKQYYDKLGKEALDDADKVATEAAAVKALPQDKAIRNKKLAEYESRNNAWYEKYKNNLSAGLGELRTIKQDFYRDMTRGQLAAIQGNYNARATHEEEVNKLYNAGKINQQRRDALLQYDLMGYQGVGQENPEGKYNSYSGSTPAEEINVAKMADELVSGWKANKIATGGYSMDKEGKLFKDSFVNNKHIREYVLDEEIYDAISPVLRNDPKVNSFIDQETKLATAKVDPNATYQIAGPDGKPVQVTGKSLIDNYKESMYSKPISFVVAKHGFTQKEDTQSDLTFLPEYLGGERDATGQMYLTNNLNSIKVPAVKGMKVNTSTLGNTGWEGVYSGGTGGGGWYSGRSLEKIPAKPEDIKFTPEQEEIYKKSGKTAKNNVEKGKIINEAIDEFNSNLIFPGIKIYDYASKPVADRAERENEMFFGTPLAASTRNFKTMTGDVENPTGKEFYENFGNDKKYIKSVTAKLQPDNPYYVGGRMVTVKDKSTGEIVGTFAMSGSDQEMNNPKDKTIHQMAQARYTPTGKTTLPLSIQDDNGNIVTKNYIVTFESQKINDKQTIEKAALVDPETNNKISEIVNDGSSGQGTFDLLFNSVR